MPPMQPAQGVAQVSIEVITQCWDLDLPPTEKLVLMKMADHADDHGRNAFPSIHTIATACRVSDRTVQRAIRTLIEAGYLVLDKPSTPTFPATYRVTPAGRGDKLSPPAKVRRATRVSSPGDVGDERGDTSDGSRDTHVTLTVLNRPRTVNEPSLLASYPRESDDVWSAAKAQAPRKYRPQLDVLEVQCIEAGRALLLAQAVEYCADQEPGNYWAYCIGVLTSCLKNGDVPGNPKPRLPERANGQRAGPEGGWLRLNGYDQEGREAAWLARQ